MKPRTDLHPWLVTGAAGFLGSHVIEQLLARQIPVIGVDNLWSGKWEFLAPFAANSGFRFVCKDIRDEANLVALFEVEQPKVVVHLAAVHFIPAAIRDPALTVSLNVHGTQSLLSACGKFDVQRFWYASTADVYRASESAHKESSTIGPFNIYGLSKWMGEELLQLDASMHPERHYVIGRLFNLYGPRETNPHILPEIISQIRTNHSDVLRLGTVSTRRDLVPVADAARAVIEMTEKSCSGITVANIGTGVCFTMREVVERIATLLGRALKIETDPSKVRPIERQQLQADVTQLQSFLGWVPHSDLSRGLHELLSFEGVMR
jgi:UDP-glucose 4-epimerase